MRDCRVVLLRSVVKYRVRPIDESGADSTAKVFGVKRVVGEPPPGVLALYVGAAISMYDCYRVKSTPPSTLVPPIDAPTYLCDT